METISLKLVGNYGVNSDIAPYELPPEFFTSGINFRVRNGSVFPAGGSLKVFESPGAGEYGFLMHIRAKDADYWIAASRESVWITDGGSSPWVNVSSGAYGIPSGSQYDWVGSQLGQILVLNNPIISPEYWLSSGVNPNMTPLPFSPSETWADRNLRCKTMRVHKNFLIAMNLSGTEEQPNGYRISHPASENGIPYTWDTTDRSSIAVDGQLGSDGGEIVDGRTLRDSFVMYSQNSIDSFNFSPSSEFYWARSELSSTVGLISPRCLTEVKGTHFLIVDGDVVSNNGSSISSLLYSKLLKRFNARSNEHTKANSYVVRNDIKKEIWFCVPEDKSIVASTAYVYSWEDSSWAIRELPEGTAHIGYGRNPSAGSTTQGITWESLKRQPAITWASMGGTSWGRRIVGSLDDHLVSIDTSGELYDIDPSGPIDEPGFNMLVERLDYPMLDHSQTASILRVFPTSRGAPFIMQIGVQNFAGGPVSWGAEHRFDPGKDRYFDIRMIGELLCYRIKSIGAGRFTFSGARVEAVPSGAR